MSLSGCASQQQQYFPVKMVDLNTAVEVVKEKINNSEFKRGISFERATEREIELRGKFRGGRTYHYIPYQYIGKINLHRKNDFYIVSVLNVNGKLEYRYYTKNEADAKQLIDAFHTLSQHSIFQSINEPEMKNQILFQNG